MYFIFVWFMLLFIFKRVLLTFKKGTELKHILNIQCVPLSQCVPTD